MTVADDCDIGPRFQNGIPVGPKKGYAIRPHLKWMVSKYYEYMGWDPETGIPLGDTLTRLGLEDIMSDVRKFKKPREKH